MHIHLKNVCKEFAVTGGKFAAVDHVSFDIGAGERVAIIGRNGAGKTTLLQVIAGLAKATSGVVDVEGHVNCIMTIGVGIREELSGRENIYIDGELNGKSRREVDIILEDVIAFAELGSYIDYPVRTYSTGMKARLAFAMIVFIKPNILIIDEALSAGDAQFSEKASAKMKEISSKGEILILVTHSMAAVVNMSNRCIWMDQGKIVMDGAPAEVTKAYREYMREYEEKKLQSRFQNMIKKRSMDSQFRIENFELLDSRRQSRMIFESGEPLNFHLSIHAATRIDRPDVRLSIRRLDGITIMRNQASRDGFPLGPVEGAAIIEASMGEIALGEQNYEVLAEFLDQDRPPDQATLATCTSVLKVEQHGDSLDRPAFFTPIRRYSFRNKWTDREEMD
jgi:lipopolysaccharide transport system ATP-binding protein